MTDEIVEDFWNEYIDADELKRIEMAKKLTIPEPYTQLAKSYYDDLIEVMIQRKIKEAIK